MTEADRLDVRAEIATAAEVSVGYMSKVKALRGAHPRLFKACRCDEISINKASLWSKESPEEQVHRLSGIGANAVSRKPSKR